MKKKDKIPDSRRLGLRNVPGSLVKAMKFCAHNENRSMEDLIIETLSREFERTEQYLRDFENARF